VRGHRTDCVAGDARARTAFAQLGFERFRSQWRFIEWLVELAFERQLIEQLWIE
jgi:hypothetical protein